MGDPNASIPTPQPVISRPMFGSNPTVLSMNCFSFISQVSYKNVLTYKLQKKLVPVRNCRKITKSSMKWNSELPNISVDPETYRVTCNGECVFSEPTTNVPLAQSVFLI